MPNFEKASKSFALFVCIVTFNAFASQQADAAEPATEKAKPNILFIFLDDYGWRDAGFMGSDFYETPHIDKLAGEGMVFTNAYAGAANCAPSRACLLSGQYSPRHEIYNVGTGPRGNAKHRRLKHIPGTDILRTDIRTWAHCIQDAGYATGTIGKWHLSKDPLPYGFDFNFAGTHSGSPPRGYFPPHPNAPGLQDAPEDEYLTDRLSDEAIGFIERNKEKPWLLYLTHFAVHTPLQAKKEIEAKYQSKTPGKLHNTPAMAAMIESVDDGVGRILAKLGELGLTENTIVVFTSDNGGYGPATDMHPLKGYKGTYYEGGIREPFFIKWPGVVDAGSKSDTPIINLDIFPTLVEMAGAKMPNQPVDGQSLLPLLTGEGNFAERSLFWHFPAYLQGYSNIDEQRDPLFRTRPCSVIRDGDWKLHEYYEDGSLELYNLRDDLGEQRNLAETEKAVAKRLHDKLASWRQEIEAPIPTEANPGFDAAAETSAIKKLVEAARRKAGKDKKSRKK